jgi:hypothetical protein
MERVEEAASQRILTFPGVRDTTLSYYSLLLI